MHLFNPGGEKIGCNWACNVMLANCQCPTWATPVLKKVWTHHCEWRQPTCTHKHVVIYKSYTWTSLINWVFLSDGSQPKVTVHVLPDNAIQQGGSAKVTLVCLVSSRVQQDFYIVWSEHTGNQTGTYTDGINFPPQRSQDGYLVSSVYTTSNWKTHMFECNVQLAGSNDSMRKVVSKAKGNSIECDK